MRLKLTRVSRKKTRLSQVTWLASDVACLGIHMRRLQPSSAALHMPTEMSSTSVSTPSDWLAPAKATRLVTMAVNGVHANVHLACLCTRFTIM